MDEQFRPLHDEVTRLVYADWLWDQGREGESERVRLAFPPVEAKPGHYDVHEFCRGTPPEAEYCVLRRHYCGDGYVSIHYQDAIYNYGSGDGYSLAWDTICFLPVHYHSTDPWGCT